MRGTNCLLLAVSTTVLLMLGCGKAEYEAAMRSRMKTLAYASQFLDNLQPDTTDIEEVATLQLPVSFDEEKTETRKAPYVQIPGFQQGFVRFIELGGRNNTHPIYCYLGSVRSAEKKQAAVLAEIKRNVLSKKFKGAAWTDVNFDTPDGEKLAFKKMSVSGRQKFDIDPDGRDQADLGGQIDIYVHSAPGVHVVVAFRATQESAAKTGVFQKIPFSLGTLVVEAIETGGEGDQDA